MHKRVETGVFACTICLKRAGLGMGKICPSSALAHQLSEKPMKLTVATIRTLALPGGSARKSTSTTASPILACACAALGRSATSLSTVSMVARAVLCWGR